MITGKDDHRAYGDFEDVPENRYARTLEFMRLVKLLWTRDDVSFHGDYFQVEHSTCLPRPFGFEDGRYPPLYFGGASAAAESVAAEAADVQLMWGEPLAMVAERIDRLNRLSAGFDRLRPLEYGLRITTVVRESSDEAWRAAEAKLSGWEGNLDRRVEANRTGSGSVGQQRLLDLKAQGDVLDRCLWTAPTRYGTGAASTWLVGSGEEVVAALEDYARLGVTHFILSDTPYREEAARVGDLVATPMGAAVPSALE
jgi:alkanesulfonate monooxygenase